VPITPGLGGRGLTEDIVSYYAKAMKRHGFTVTPQHLSLGVGAYVADSKAQAVQELGPYHLYFHRTLFSHGNITETSVAKTTGYVTDASLDYIRPENLKIAARSREDFRGMTMKDVERAAEDQPWGTADEVRDRIIAAAEHAGAETVLVSMNRGALPQELFLNQIRRFAKEVLPALQAHKITRVPAAEEMAA
jgi:alkanesulfonate monooxygenase SsuD/methylene tetrahydromethanopterin reductase-like flavin-dependent oxidoreductase (luciferase family)